MTTTAMTTTMTNNICYYCEGKSKCIDINLYEGEGGYREDDTRFRIICGNCFPQVNHQGGRSWGHIYKIKSKTDDINKIIKFMTDQDTKEEDTKEEEVWETCDTLNKGYKVCMNEFEDNEEVWCEECKYLKSVWICKE